ncbi:MAG TPA: hypothetical protein VK196_22625 [Magnetospirillum sp.]|nr:hypothetical protein [Magnetospirillum sp.]
MVIHDPWNVPHFGRKKKEPPRVQPAMQKKIFTDHSLLWGTFVHLDWAEQAVIEGQERLALSMLRAARDVLIRECEERTGMQAEEGEGAEVDSN